MSAGQPTQLQPPKAPLKAVTNFFASVIVIGATFAVSPAGVALIHQYPKLAVVAGGLGAIAALYHSPRES